MIFLIALNENGSTTARSSLYVSEETTKGTS